MGAKLTQDTYNLVKGLIRAEKPDAMIANVLGISRATINRIQRSGNFDEYKMIQASYKAKPKEEKQEEPKEEQLEVPGIDKDLMMINMFEHLKMIYLKLCELMEELR